MICVSLLQVTRCLTCLALLLSVTSTSAEPQLFGLLRDKLPPVLPTRSTSTTAAPEISSTTPSTTTTSSPAGDSNPAANVQHLQALQALHDIQSIHALQNLQALQNIQNLQNLQTAVERAKRSGNILQLLGGASGSSSGSSSGGGGPTADAPYPASLGSAAPAYGAPAPAPAPAALGGGGGLLGGRGILSAILGSSSSNSATAGVAVDGKGPTYGNYIGMGAGLPMVYGQRSFDFQSFRQSLLGVLMQAVRAITGGVIALKGQLVRVKGQLLSAKGNIISASGEALSQFGRNIASNALRPKPPEPPGQS
ncbi:hypothetical protein FOCC_FOCC016108 [Frankliniella occidentalis]|nr:hypothetical protein FOCC_FOCC016108 [Frankliniella occidentalis]